MTPILSTVMKSGRAAIVAVTLGAATLTAMPVQAQSEPQFSFQLGIGGGNDAQTYSKGKKQGRIIIDDCLTNRQVERGLRQYGFRNVDVI
ncbi:MAG: hypothetical protein JNK01_10915, partial [Devosia sp.]|nr:hypothetical protein [Devosia sp.]